MSIARLSAHSHARRQALFMLVPFVLVGLLPLLLAYWLVSSSESSTLAQLEAQTAARDAAVANRALATRFTDLQRAVSDYGVWDAMQQAALHRDPVLFRANMPDSVLGSYHLSSAQVLDNAFRPLYTVGAPPPMALLQHALLTASSPAAEVIGPDGPFLVVSSPVERENHPLRRSGTLVFTQRIDRALLHDLAEITGDPMVVFPAAGAAVVSQAGLFDPVLLARLRQGTRAGHGLVRQEGWAMMGFALMPRLGLHGPVLAVIASRYATLQAERDLHLRAIGAVCGALVLAIGAGFAMSRGIVMPLAHIAHACRMLASGQTPSHLTAVRGGALGDLIKAFDTLSTHLESIVQERVAVASRERLASIVDSSPDAIIGLTLSGVIDTWNSGATRMFGYPAEEALGQLMPTVVFPYGDKPLPELLQAAMNGETEEPLEGRGRHRDGREIAVSLTMSAVRDAQGTLAGLACIARDITAHKQAEAALLASERRFRTIIETSPIGFSLTNLAGRFEAVNHAYCALLGYEPEELIGEMHTKMFAPEEQAEHLRRHQEVLELRHARRDYDDVRRKTGETLTVLTSMAAVAGPDGQPRRAAFVMDVTETVQARRQAEQARAAAVELAELRSDFVASVSHELRTPLTAIIGYGELLQARWDRLGEAQRLERLGRIVLAANRQKRLVDDLLHLTRLENGVELLSPGAVDVLAAAQAVVSETAGTYPGQRVELEGLAGVAVLAVADRFIQILATLVDNAAKYSPEGSPIVVSWRVEGTRMHVRVRDFGPGIAEEHRARLFTRFGRVPGSRMRAGHVGTGLGLYLGRQLAQSMDGELDLETSSRSGSVFSLRLPATGTTVEPLLPEEVGGEYTLA